MLFPMLVLEPMSYIENSDFAIVYLTWVEFVYWYMITAFWIGPLFMMIAQSIGEEVEVFTNDSSGNFKNEQ